MQKHSHTTVKIAVNRVTNRAYIPTTQKRDPMLRLLPPRRQQEYEIYCLCLSERQTRSTVQGAQGRHLSQF